MEEKEIEVVYWTDEEMEEMVKKWLVKATEENDPIAQSNLGMYYSSKYDMENYEEESAKWYRLAAENGDAESMHMLAWCYEDGEGVPQDYEKAMEWYQKSVDNGVNSYTNIGRLYRDGRGVAQDEKKAFEYFKKAADKGCVEGMCELIECYIQGIGTEKNIEKAKEYNEIMKREKYVNANGEYIDYFPEDV